MDFSASDDRLLLLYDPLPGLLCVRVRVLDGEYGERGSGSGRGRSFEAQSAGGF
jgi:hypothetical protein